MRLIHVPKLHSGGMGLLPVTLVYSSRISLGEPKNTKMSICSSAIKRRCAPMYEAPKSAVTGADVCMKMP